MFEELARIEPTVTMEVTPNFGLYRLLDPTKTVSFPVTQRILSGGGRIGSLVFEGALHVSHNIVDVHHDSSVRAGETCFNFDCER